MKKLFFLSIPLIMAGVVAFGAKNVEANYAEFDISRPSFPGYGGDKIDLPHRPIIDIRPKLRNYTNDDVDDMNNGESVSGSYSLFSDITGVSSYLGYGYNVITSPYMDKDYVRMQNPIIDMDAIKSTRLTLVKEHRFDVMQYEGTSIEEFCENYDVSANVYGSYGKLFSGGLKAEFKGSSSTKKFYYFCKTDYLKRSFNIYLGGGAATLKNKLSDSFINDLETMSPAQLFHDYGTHVIAGVSMGGRISLNTTYSSETADYTTEVMAAVNTHVKYMGANINAEASAQYENALTSQNIFQTTNIHTLGGASVDTGSVDAVLSNRAAWLASFDADLSVSAMCGVVNDQSLIPLWDLVDDSNPERKEELEDYFVQAAGDAYADLCSAFKLNTERYVNVDTGGRGYINGNKGVYNRGETATLTAVANSGYAFDGWYAGNTKVSANPTYTFEVTTDTNLRVDFKEVYVAPNGSPEHPYKISTKQDFINIKNNIEACYELEKDIDFGNTKWEPIEEFYGSIDGNGHTLSRIKLEKTSGLGNNVYFEGLFRYLRGESVISNLTISNSTLNYKVASGESALVYAGFICGYQDRDAVVENVKFVNTTATMKVNFSLVGTVSGYCLGTIRNCRIEGGKVFGYDVVGGFAGTLDRDYAEAENCVITMNSSGTRSEISLESKNNRGGSYRAGGIAGYCFEGAVRGCKVEKTNFKLSGYFDDRYVQPAMGYVVGHSCYGYISESTVNTGTINRTNNLTNYSKYYFKYGGGKVGRNEGNNSIS